MGEPVLLHRSRKFSLVRIDAPTRDGGSHAYDILLHPGAAVILPLLDPDTVILTHNFRVSIGDELLELPAGTLEPGEPPEQCAGRELAEETGYTAEKLSPLCSFYSAPGFCNERLYAFVAEGLNPGPQRLETSERIRIQPMSWKEIFAALREGRLIDAKSIAALLYYDRLVRSNR